MREITPRGRLVSAVMVTLLQTSFTLSLPADTTGSSTGSSTRDQDEACGIRPTCPTSISSTSSSIYERSNDASAQAYKPDAPVKTTICDIGSDAAAMQRHRVAGWRMYRRSSSSVPVISITGRIHRCEVNEAQRSTCASSMVSTSNQDHSDNNSVSVEAWQARPDGTYSSLRPTFDEGDCRATIVPSSDGTFYVETLTPGSVGMFSGIGPNGMDLPPFSAPTINFLLQSEGTLPLLANIEVLSDEGTGGKNDSSAEVSSWNMDAEGNVSIEVDFFLSARKQATGEDDTDESLESIMCPTLLYGLPNSFFTQPLSVCAPSLLNFFEL
jgi:hypothetical protein